MIVEAPLVVAMLGVIVILVVAGVEENRTPIEGKNNSGGSDNQNSASSATYTGNGNSQGLGKQYAPAEVLGSPGNTSKNV